MSETHYYKGFGWYCPTHGATFEGSEGEPGKCPWCGEILER